METICFDKPVYRICGDTGLLIEFGKGISPQIHSLVMSTTRALKKKDLPGVIEVIPTYTAIMVIYDPLITNPDHLSDSLSSLEQNSDDPDTDPPGLVEIPVCYENDFAPDLHSLAQARGLTPEEVVRIHSSVPYLIYMVGFTPGFAFLGGLDPRLHTPRLSTPRTRVPKGSVGIANNQTGMYSIESPGGWQLIGRTPLTLFAPERPDPFLYRPGDQIRFIPVSKARFARIAQQEKEREEQLKAGRRPEDEGNQNH